ncbi:MAG: metal-dependent hydrolase [Halarchaeum sp.]
MPSTLVHVAVGAVVAAALLGSAYSRRAVLVVLAAAALPDLDSFTAVLLPGTHRALLHTLLLPAAVGAVVAWDARREDSWLRSRRGVRIAWVAVAALFVGGVGPDLVTNGVNALYPIHDRFYTLNGHLWLSNARGLVQTFVTADAGGGTTETTFYYTGVDVARGADPANAERIFPVVDSGTQALVCALGALCLWGRDRDARDS